MSVVLLAVGVVALAMLGLGLGVLLGKRTPLKGECHGFDPDRPAGSTCSACACGAASLTGAATNDNPNEGEAR
jgi:hypothetical protein